MKPFLLRTRRMPKCGAEDLWEEGSFDGGAEGSPYKALETISTNKHFH
jgi:hypothetical protein